VTSERAEEWKKLSGLGAKLIELLWKAGIADKAAVGSYEFNVSMP